MSYTLYIMLPGPCNARCPFCCWTRKAEPHEEKVYIAGLVPILDRLIPHSHSINVLGGEPLISPLLRPVLDLLRSIPQKPKVVLTTNGSMLPSQLDYFPGAINHVNLSRHALTDTDNIPVFGSPRAFLPGAQILSVAERLAQFDIDLSVNCVLYENTTMRTQQDILDFIRFVDNCGAVATCFKKLEGDSLDETPQQRLFNYLPIVCRTTCDVCRTDLQEIDRKVVYWQAALNRPSVEVRDLIVQPNLTVTRDWLGKMPYEIEAKSA